MSAFASATSHSRLTFVKRMAVAAAVGVPAVKALMSSQTAQAGDFTVLDSRYVGRFKTGKMVPSDGGPLVPECQICSWVDIGGTGCCCLCGVGELHCGEKYGCFDPHDGALCACGCGDFCPCNGTGCTR